MTPIETKDPAVNPNSSERKDRFTNEKCHLLLDRFETFARQLQKQEKEQQKEERAARMSTSASSQFSTLDSRRSRTGFDATDTRTSSTTFSSPSTKSTTLYSNSAFKHDVLKNSAVDRSIDHGQSRIISRTSDSKLRNKVSFVETNHVSDGTLAKILLDLDLSDDSAPVPLESMSDTVLKVDLPDFLKSETAESSDENVINELDAENLEPSFLLIDDEIDDDEEETGNKSRATSLLTSVSNRTTMERGKSCF